MIMKVLKFELVLLSGLTNVADDRSKSPYVSVLRLIANSVKTIRTWLTKLTRYVSLFLLFRFSALQRHNRPRMVNYLSKLF